MRGCGLGKYCPVPVLPTSVGKPSRYLSLACFTLPGYWVKGSKQLFMQRHTLYPRNYVHYPRNLRVVSRHVIVLCPYIRYGEGK